GDKLTIIACKGENWYIAKDKDGRTGDIPVNYVSQLQTGVLGTNFWFVGEIMGRATEKILLKKAFYMGEIHENWLGEVLPYQSEPVLNENS
ncbi:tyrosine- kinase CSK, partial [Paramuricea clavata]